MAGITGGWKAKQGIMSGAKKQGTGINPVHYQYGGQGRDIAPGEQILVLPDELEPTRYEDPLDDNLAENLWGYDQDTGTSDRPPLGMDPQDFRNNSNDFPEWGEYENGLPGGSNIRDEDHGALVRSTPKQTPDETVSEGWLNKVHGTVSNSRVSDTSQLFMQTSQTQRDKTRAGSQMPEGRANEQDAPIRSRIPGKKLRFFSGGERHYDMFPQQQDPSLRPWWNRNAGTGYPEWLEPNFAYESLPMTRVVPPDPYTGPDVAQGDTSNDYGYTDEDVMPYA
jgi:hypothetical protein